jgi:hypothetical protein
MKSSTAFVRRSPDRVAEELVAALSTNESWEFKALFSVVHANLKARNAASGGEEMLRLRAYERLQTFVGSGVATKVGKEYRGVTAGLAAYAKSAAELKEQIEARKASQPAAQSKN